MKLLKKISFLSFLLASSLISQAQSADEIITKHLNAIGGKETWAKVTNLVYKGGMNAGGAELEMNMEIINKKAMRLDISVMGMKGYQIVTDKEGWSFMPFAGQSKPEPMTTEQVAAAKEQLNIGSEFLTYKEDNKTIDFLGKEDVDGTECFKIKLTGASKKETTYFIDPATYYIVKQTDKMTVDGKEQEQNSTFSNYKKIEPGITVAHTIGSPQGDIEMKEIKANQTIADTDFKPSK